MCKGNHWCLVTDTRGPFYLHGLTLIPAWTSNYTHYKVWDEFTYLFQNLNGASNFIPPLLDMWLFINAGIKEKYKWL